MADIDHFDTRLRSILNQVAPGRRGQARLEAGDAPEEVMVSLSREYDAVVVGPREPSALERMLRGTMAVRVLLRAHCPVLVPRGDPNGDGPTRVLVGVDLDGPVQQPVVQRAGDWAAHMGGTLDLVYAVAERIPTIREPAVAEAAEKEWLAGHQGLVDKLQVLRDTLPEAIRGDVLLRRGDPEGVLVQLSGDYDLVVVGNRERQGLSGMLLGAVAQQVVRRSLCGVLTLNTADLPT